MKLLKILSLVLSFAGSLGCAKRLDIKTDTQNTYFNDAYACEVNTSDRIGARCKDGSLSKSTGRGTCSSHGGVDVWLCK